jgi:hypothetical protein
MDLRGFNDLWLLYSDVKSSFVLEDRSRTKRPIDLHSSPLRDFGSVRIGFDPVQSLRFSKELAGARNASINETDFGSDPSRNRCSSRRSSRRDVKWWSFVGRGISD